MLFSLFHNNLKLVSYSSIFLLGMFMLPVPITSSIAVCAAHRLISSIAPDITICPI